MADRSELWRNRGQRIIIVYFIDSEPWRFFPTSGVPGLSSSGYSSPAGMQPSQALRKNLPVRLSRKTYKMSKLGYQGCLRGFSMRVYFHAPSWSGDQSAYIPTENCLTQPQPPSLNLSLRFVTGQLIIKLNWNQLLVGCHQLIYVCIY